MPLLQQLLARSMFPTLPAYLASALVLLVAEAVYVLFGFGAGLIAVGSLAMLLEHVTDPVVLLLLVNLPPEAYVVRRNWRHIAWRGALLICVGIAAGVPLGTLLLKYGSTRVVLLVLGCFLIAAGLAFLVLPPGRRVQWPGWSSPAVGLVSGVLAGMLGTGGPPLILYYRLAGVDKATFRGNLMAIFLVITLVRLPTYALTGFITPERLVSAALVFPAVLGGAAIGNYVHLTIRELTFQRLVAVALVLLGVLLLLR
jgi:hypothetical protein